MEWLFGDSALDAQRKMIFGLLKRQDQIIVTLAKLSRSLLDAIEADTADEYRVKSKQLKQLLKAIAMDGGEYTKGDSDAV